MPKTHTQMPKTHYVMILNIFLDAENAYLYAENAYPYAENALVIFEHSFRQCQKRIPLCRKRIHHMLKTHRSLDSWCHKQALDLGKKIVERLQFSHSSHNPRSREKWFGICLLSWTVCKDWRISWCSRPWLPFMACYLHWHRGCEDINFLIFLEGHIPSRVQKIDVERVRVKQRLDCLVVWTLKAKVEKVSVFVFVHSHIYLNLSYF